MKIFYLLLIISMIKFSTQNCDHATCLAEIDDCKMSNSLGDARNECSQSGIFIETTLRNERYGCCSDDWITEGQLDEKYLTCIKFFENKESKFSEDTNGEYFSKDQCRAFEKKDKTSVEDDQ